MSGDMDVGRRGSFGPEEEPGIPEDKSVKKSDQDIVGVGKDAFAKLKSKFEEKTESTLSPHTMKPRPEVSHSIAETKKLFGERFDSAPRISPKTNEKLINDSFNRATKHLDYNKEKGTYFIGGQDTGLTPQQLKNLISLSISTDFVAQGELTQTKVKLDEGRKAGGHTLLVTKDPSGRIVSRELVLSRLGVGGFGKVMKTLNLESGELLFSKTARTEKSFKREVAEQRKNEYESQLEDWENDVQNEAFPRLIETQKEKLLKQEDAKLLEDPNYAKRSLTEIEEEATEIVQNMDLPDDISEFATPEQLKNKPIDPEANPKGWLENKVAAWEKNVIDENKETLIAKKTEELTESSLEEVVSRVTTASENHGKSDDELMELAQSELRAMAEQAIAEEAHTDKSLLKNITPEQLHFKPLDVDGQAIKLAQKATAETLREYNNLSLLHPEGGEKAAPSSIQPKIAFKVTQITPSGEIRVGFKGHNICEGDGRSLVDKNVKGGSEIYKTFHAPTPQAKELRQNIIGQLFDGIAYAHKQEEAKQGEQDEPKQKIFHLDLKPANFLAGRFDKDGKIDKANGQLKVYIADWGGGCPRDEILKFNFTGSGTGALIAACDFIAYEGCKDELKTALTAADKLVEEAQNKAAALLQSDPAQAAKLLKGAADKSKELKEAAIEKATESLELILGARDVFAMGVSIYQMLSGNGSLPYELNESGFPDLNPPGFNPESWRGFLEKTYSSTQATQMIKLLTDMLDPITIKGVAGDFYTDKDEEARPTMEQVQERYNEILRRP